MRERGYYDQGAPVGKGRSAQAKTVTGKVSSQESKLGGHRKNAGGGRGYTDAREYSGKRDACMTPRDDRAKLKGT